MACSGKPSRSQELSIFQYFINSWMFLSLLGFFFVTSNMTQNGIVQDLDNFLNK